MKFTGRSIIGDRESSGMGATFRARNPVTGEELDPEFVSATPDEVNLAADLARQAFDHYSRTSGREKGKFLRKIASNVEAIANEVVERAVLETALPQARLQAETART